MDGQETGEGVGQEGELQRFEIYTSGAMQHTVGENP